MKQFRFLGLLVAFLFFAEFAHAATVTGTVKGPDGTPFRGAFVQAQNTGTRVLVSVLTGKDGRYRIENLPAGNISCRSRPQAIAATPRGDVNLAAEQSASYDFALQKGMVRWSDLSQYQGEVLFPDTKGKGIADREMLCLPRVPVAHGIRSS